jgi:deoxyribose-phosphate aldolase
MDLAKYIDHTFLKPDGDADAIRRLCREAKKHGFASVCVNPCEVGLAARLLRGSRVAVCTVVGFPLGQNTFSIKRAEALDAVAHGAAELDFVINVRLLKHDPDACAAELDGLVAACREARDGLVLKLIIECCYLTDSEKRLACRLAKKAGFDFVKTSTGFGPGGATARDVKLMRRAVGPKMGVKAAGSIRTREDALAMIAAGATRLGCSAGVQIVG